MKDVATGKQSRSSGNLEHLHHREVLFAHVPLSPRPLTYSASIQHGDLLSRAAPPLSGACPRLSQESLRALGCIVVGQGFSMGTRGFMTTCSIRSKLVENQLPAWESGRKNLFPPDLFQSCLPLSQSAESAAWSCSENLIRSHGAKHIEFQEAAKLLPLEVV